MATGYIAVEQNEPTVDGTRWRDIAVVPVSSTAEPRVETREARPRSLNPADELYRQDAAQMVAGAKAAVAAADAASAASPNNEDLWFQADLARQILNAVQIMAAASTEEMARQQRDRLWPMVSTCAINGWYEISDPVADFVMDTRPGVESAGG